MDAGGFPAADKEAAERTVSSQEVLDVVVSNRLLTKMDAYSSCTFWICAYSSVINVIKISGSIVKSSFMDVSEYLAHVVKTG